MKIVRIVLGVGLVILLIILLRGWSASDEPSNTITYNSDGESITGTYTQSLMHDELTRDYIIHLPARYSADNEYPLVVLLHGGGGNAERTLVQTNATTLADEKGFILVVPNAVEGNWNDGRGFTAWDRTTDTVSQIDDVGFIRSLVSELVDSYSVDTSRVYVTGMSNGGLMTNRLACEASDIFAAAGPVASPMWGSAADRCVNSAPIPIVGVQGTNDPFYPIYDTDGIPSLPPLLVRQGVTQTPLHVSDVTNFWTTVNGCANAPTINVWPDIAGDGTIVSEYQYNECDGEDVVFYIVAGAGHGWLTEEGAGTRLAEISGGSSKNIDVLGVIWDFFVQHSL